MTNMFFGSPEQFIKYRLRPFAFQQLIYIYIYIHVMDGLFPKDV